MAHSVKNIAQLGRGLMADFCSSVIDTVQGAGSWASEACVCVCVCVCVWTHRGYTDVTDLGRSVREEGAWEGGKEPQQCGCHIMRAHVVRNLHTFNPE